MQMHGKALNEWMDWTAPGLGSYTLLSISLPNAMQSARFRLSVSGNEPNMPVIFRFN
jgi:hypothetical protein